MSAYATFTDVLKRYNPLTTMIGTGTQDVTTTDISSIYVADAEGFVNAFLSSRYVIPLAMPEPIITQITADIAIYKLLEDRAPRIPEFAQARYTNVVSLLMMLRDGGMSITSQTGVLSGDQYVWSNVFSTPPAFQSAESNLSSSFCSSIDNSNLF